MNNSIDLDAIKAQAADFPGFTAMESRLFDALEASRAEVEQLRADNERLAALNADLQWQRTYTLDHRINQLRIYLHEAEGKRDAALARIRAVEALFAGGPDTPCRTIWQDGIECVSVPIADLRAALAAPTEDSDHG